ncbi:alkaline phosphatase [Gallaecimonas sp. GXIMD4217]|uniref:alkaline phosphatase n=1 Tax=Gallaecimonas sp. GXIMD4217 TaxID=3131927 RepID=UPI00311AFCF0
MKHSALYHGICAALFGASLGAQAAVLPAHQTASPWFTEGAALAADKASAQAPATKAKNVILFVGDGMGISTLTAARILEGQQSNPDGGEEHLLSFEKFPHTALVKTYNTNQQTPDSAGTMTAMVTGVKSKAGFISVTQDALRGDCQSARGQELITALELAEQKGLATGVVSTARLTHATPAATYAHVPERGWEHDGQLPAEAKQLGCTDIAAQLIDFPHGDGIDVALGGGRRNFIPAEVTDGEGKSGRRTDGRDLTAEWASRDGAAYVWDQAGFDAIDPAGTDKLLGLFNSSHMEYEADRADDTAGEPSLTEMTTKAMDLLARNNNGYFLTVEAGRIDHGHHAGNAHRALTDAVEFARAVQAAVDKAGDDTLILVTADHSHVLTIGGYPRRGNPILGLVENQDGSLSLAADGKPYTTLGYQNGPGAVDGERADLSEVDTQDKDFMQQALVPMSSETHAGEDISLHAKGPGAQLVQGAIEQNVVFHVINQALELGGTSY